MKKMRQAGLRLAATFAFALVLSAPPTGEAQEPLPRDVIVQSIDGVVGTGIEWQLVWQGTSNADGIIANPDGGLLFAQEQARQIGKLDADGRYSVYLSGTHGVGSLSIDSEGRLWGVERTCTDPGRQAGGECTEPTAIAIIAPERRVLADHFADGTTLGRLNDLIVDGRGGAYFTVGGAYYASPQGRVTSLGEGLSTNGIMLSPDGGTLYVTNRNVIVAFDVAAGGATGNRRDFAMLEAGGNGDGMAVDRQGRLFVSSAPGIQVLDASGNYLGLIPSPRPAISVAFSGRDKSLLYIVGRGARLGPNGSEYVTPEGVRNNAKSIYRLQMLTQGLANRAK